MVLRFTKIPETTSTLELHVQKQALTSSPENSFSKQVFGKLLGRPASVLKLDFAMDVSLGSFQKYTLRPRLDAKFLLSQIKLKINYFYQAKTMTLI